MEIKDIKKGTKDFDGKTVDTLSLTIDKHELIKKLQELGSPGIAQLVENHKYASVFLNGFRGNWNMHWDIGMDISKDFVEREQIVSKDSNGVTYYNFRAPASAKKGNTQELEKRMKEIVKAINDLGDRVATLEGGRKDVSPAENAEPDEEIAIEDVPF